MYVVTVEFEIQPEHVDKFRTLIIAQAHTSLTKEEHCTQFDVCICPKDQSRYFLYELYAKEKDFQAHLESDHFQQFNECSQAWVRSKKVTTYFQLEK